MPKKRGTAQEVFFASSTQPVFMLCRMVEAHQLCWLLLHALFMNAKVPRIPTAIVVRTINTEVFIATSLRSRRTFPTTKFYRLSELNINVVQHPI